ncbi:MAG TPA: phosphate ABC transporter permease subunit PstC [Dehalococcoidia bacterium]|nr:phosphate ABC transporter permease subunit PstC [Dehalococcoidia bacterium]
MSEGLGNAGSPPTSVVVLRHRLGAVPWGDALFQGVVAVSGLAVLALAGLLAFQLADAARPAYAHNGWRFLTETTWNPVALQFGGAPAIYGTLVSSFLALLLALPVSIGTAIFLAELAPAWLRDPLSFLVEMLAAIPSVVYGLWGLFVMVPLVRDPIQAWLGDNLGFIPLFSGPAYGLSMMAGGFILAIMIIPIVTAISRDVILTVPQSQREAMLALGATRWEMVWGAVLPYARPGIVGAVLLGLGRALGETMAVTMVMGNVWNISSSVFAPAHSIASAIASEFTEAVDDVYIATLIELALVLFTITLLVNILARLLLWRIAGSLGRVRE